MGKIKCLNCNKVLESKSVHDFVQCNCPNETFVDGGQDYLRTGGVDPTKIQVLDSEPSIETEPEIVSMECKERASNIWDFLSAAILGPAMIAFAIICVLIIAVVTIVMSPLLLVAWLADVLGDR